MGRKALLVCGILSSLLYAGMTAFVAMQWEGYSSASRPISELSAIGAPTRDLWMLLGIPYTLLVLAFGWGVWTSAGRSRALRIAGVLILVFGALGFVWPFAPMHLRETLATDGGTASDTLHLVLSGVTVVLMLLAIGFVAAAFGRGFRIYSIVTFVILLVFGVLTGLDAPALAANRPTPWLGVWERISIGAFLLWVIVVAITLLRTRAERSRGGLGAARSSGHRMAFAGAIAASLSLFGPGRADAQSPAYLSVLAIPPSTVGTCITVPRSSGRDSLRSRDRELVMTTLDPTGRREIRVYVDTTGRIGGYSDVVSAFNGSDTATGDNIVARLARDGRWRGIRFGTVVHAVGNDRGPDGRLLRRPPVRGEHTPAHALTTAEQALVGELVTWMRTRCPA